MSSKLVIVESPSKSKTIEQYLGSDYVVKSSKGHIRDLAISGPGGLGIDVKNHFHPTYAILPEKKQTIKELNQALKNASELYLATDPDREGEAISWHLLDTLNVEDKPVKRVIFNEITKDAIKEAFEHPKDIDQNLVESQETRRILDRIIGFKLSKLLQNKIKSKSAGRVQSAALKLITDREKEISEALGVDIHDTIDFTGGGRSRGESILRYVLDHEVEKYVVLDDSIEHYVYGLGGNFVQVNGLIGLSFYDVQLALRILEE